MISEGSLLIVEFVVLFLQFDVILTERPGKAASIDIIVEIVV